MSLQRIVLHIDMNSYFASVEQQANPFLRGRAIGVCAYLSENGCILASSMEAKQHGVRTGMRVRDARQRWPATIFLQNDPPKYRSTTERIFNILAQYSDRIEPYSIDEAFLDLTGWTERYSTPPLKIRGGREATGPQSLQWRLLAGTPRNGGVMNDIQSNPIEVARRIGLEINQRVKREVGAYLRSSIGIAETRFFAKLAADTGPKDTVTTLPPASVPQYLEKLSLTDIWGIARATERKLAALGIATPNAFRTADPAKILSSLGSYGAYLWSSLNGQETHEAIIAHAQQKSIGHSYCLPKKTKDKSYLAANLMKLAEKTGRRLRAKSLEARGLYVSWGYARGGGSGKHMRLPAPLWDSWEIFSTAYRPLTEASLTDNVSFLAVGVTTFAPPTPQISLFPVLNDVRQKKYALSRALDAVNNKWGEYTVQRGVMHGTEHNAPDRVGYRKSLSAPLIDSHLTSSSSPAE